MLLHYLGFRSLYYIYTYKSEKSISVPIKSLIIFFYLIHIFQAVILKTILFYLGQNLS